MFNRDISVKFISTINQVADIFTKALSSARFAHLTSKLMVIPPPIINMAKDNAKPLSKDHVAAQNSNVPIVIT